MKLKMTSCEGGGGVEGYRILNWLKVSFGETMLDLMIGLLLNAKHLMQF